jgi:hypothetical protein
VFALVLVQVDEWGGGGDGLKGRLFDGRRSADKGDHSAVMVAIRADIEHVHTVYGANAIGDGVVDRGIAAVTKIRDTFNEGLHDALSFGLGELIPIHRGFITNDG